MNSNAPELEIETQSDSGATPLQPHIGPFSCVTEVYQHAWACFFNCIDDKNYFKDSFLLQKWIDVHVQYAPFMTRILLELC